MIIVLKPDLSPQSEQVKNILETAKRFKDVSTDVHVIKGSTRSLTEVYLIGSTGTIPEHAFSGLAGVEKVIRIREKYRSIGRHDESLSASSFNYNGIEFSQDHFHLLPGLCAVDNPQNVEAMFKTLKSFNIQTTRAGAYKPRTSPYDFQGHGKACLPYLFELAGKYDIKVISMEITHESQIDEITQELENAGNPTGVMLQIGTRNAQNFELLKFVGQQKRFPVLFKRGMGITLQESLNACEYVASGGNRNIIFCLRGMKTNFGDPHRNFVDFAHVPTVKRLTRLPVAIDPSHSVGKRSSGPEGILDIFHVTAQGIIAGANLALVDFHPDPQNAMCDGPQALHTSELEKYLEDINLVRECFLKRKENLNQ